MLDLSKYADDKDSYILRTEINDDLTKFKVIYASGREEEFDFSIHNYQVYLYRMEEQFNTYAQMYKREAGLEFTKEMKSAMLWSLVDIVSIFVTCNMDFSIASKIILSFLAAILLIRNIGRVAMAKQVLHNKAMKYAVVKSYILNKENFAVDVKDPNTGREEKWYVIDFNDLDVFNNEFELRLAAIPVQIPAFREQFSRSFNEGEGAMTIKK